MEKVYMECHPYEFEPNESTLVWQHAVKLYLPNINHN